MENEYRCTVLIFFLHRRGPLPTAAAAYIFISPVSIPYIIFAVAAELIGDIYPEMAVVSYSTWSMRR